jgi:hypothetical protein
MSINEMVEFIFLSGAAAKDEATKKTIRSRAMRSYRERQRKEDSRNGETSNGRNKMHRYVRGTYSAARPLLPAIAPDRPQDSTPCIGEKRRGRELDGCREESSSEREESQPRQDLGQVESQQQDLSRATDSNCGGVLKLPHIANHHVWRQQLGYAFLTSYYADSVVGTIHKDWHQLPGEAARWGPTLTASRDAWCLIHLGTRFCDGRLLAEGRKRHGVGLRLLRERIEQPDSVVCDDLLHACYTLAHCQIYRSVSHQGGIGWQVHISGLLFMVQRRGPNSFLSPFSLSTLHNIRQISAMHQLIERKRSFLSSPEWLMSRWQSVPPGMHAPALKLTDLALRLSGALEDSDVVLRAWAAGKSVFSDQVREISLHIQSLECQLEQWLLDYYKRTGVAQKPYVLRDVPEYPRFISRSEDMALLFPQVYDFPNLLSATTHCYVFILNLAIRMAQLDLASLHPSQQTPDSETRDALAAEADGYASHLCKCLAYLSLPQHRSAGVLACGGPLYWASAWYERMGDAKKLQACQSLREVLEFDCPAPLNLKAPVFTWWMVPSVFEEEEESTVGERGGFGGGSSDIVAE